MWQAFIVRTTGTAYRLLVNQKGAIMLILNYASKKALKEKIGQPLDYTETSFFGPEYRPDGSLTGSNRPSITGIKGREFFARVTMREGLIFKVE